MAHVYTPNAWRRLYSLAAWQRLRRQQLNTHPLCERCEAAGFLVVATVVNHRIPHRGDWDRFTDPANLQSLCKPCHDGPTQADERGGVTTTRTGYDHAVAADGWPTDPRHPANQRRRATLH